MARYIKVNRKVAQYLRLENDRNRVKGGNYLLWQADILKFGKLIDLPTILEQIGGIALLAHEAREEQDGSYNRPLPIATDPRFVLEEEKAATEESGETSQESTENLPEDTTTEEEKEATEPNEETEA